jgi:hypothetical protein
MKEVLPFGKENLCIFTGLQIENAIQYFKIDSKINEFILANIFNHPKHPQNHNVRFLNNDAEMIDIWTGKEWCAYPRKDVMHDISLSLEIVRTMHHQKKLLVDLHMIKTTNSILQNDIILQLNALNESMNFLKETPRICKV